jgi:hypothetical protein
VHIELDRDDRDLGYELLDPLDLAVPLRSWAGRQREETVTANLFRRDVLPECLHQDVVVDGVTEA